MTYLNPEPHRRTFMKPFMTLDSPESAQAITGDRRRAKPEENNERQLIHEHEGVPLASAPFVLAGTRHH